MNNLNLKHIAENLLDTFFEAGKIAKQISQRGVKITIKDDQSPVTDGDLAVNELLTNKIITVGYGEISPLIKTGDNIIEEKNRRAEVFIK